MAFMKRHAFKIAVMALVVLMGIYLSITYNVFGGKEQLPVLRDVPDFTLTNMQDENETFSDSNGKVRLVYFFFANCPEECPATTVIAKDVQEVLKERGEFGSKVEFKWISIDPERDTPTLIKSYAEGYGADPAGWSFLRGEAEQIVEVAKGFDIGVRNAGGPENLIHSDIIAVVDQEGRIRSYIRGGGDETLTPERILQDVDSLLD